jgi:hypothetical protein
MVSLVSTSWADWPPIMMRKGVGPARSRSTSRSPEAASGSTLASGTTDNHVPRSVVSLKRCRLICLSGMTSRSPLNVPV